MNPGYLPCVEIEPRGTAKHSVIWLHGLGASGHDFEPIVPQLGLDPDLGVRFLFPHAPKIPVSINMGLIMPAWYDIRSPHLGDLEDEERILESTEQVRKLVSRENERGIETEHIVLAGFSQGGSIALHAGLRHPVRLAGTLALSCYLIRENTLEEEATAVNRDIPIFQAHRSFDMMVPALKGEAGKDRLEALGYAVTWKTYPMAHEVHRYEIRDIGAWLGETFR